MNDPTTLYRMSDDKGDLLYVGIAGNPGRRFEQHRKDKPWWGEVAAITLEHYPTRAIALEAEEAAIKHEAPRHNVVHNLNPNKNQPAAPARFKRSAEPKPFEIPPHLQREVADIGWAIDRYIKANEGQSVDVVDAELLVSNVLRSLAYTDRCRGCGDYLQPLRLEDTGRGWKAVYRCMSCAKVWSCGWARCVELGIAL